jgi:histone deacetylase 6
MDEGGAAITTTVSTNVDKDIEMNDPGAREDLPAKTSPVVNDEQNRKEHGDQPDGVVDGGSTPMTGTKRQREDDSDTDGQAFEPKVEPAVDGVVTKVVNCDRELVAKRSPQLIYGGLKTGICYDVRMRYHSRITISPYDYVDPHPEDPRRIYRIYKALAEAGLLHDPTLQGRNDLGPLMLKLPVREAREDELLRVHSREHLDFIASTEQMAREQLIAETEKGDSIYLNNDSYLAAKLSCGGTIEACRAVVERRVKNAIAVVRPPGHHAEPQAPGGFCLFSNVAVAAEAMLNEYPDTVRRVLVLDWDVHHGNGTQRAFLNDDRVLYVSLHRHEGGRFYPGTPFGGHNIVGEGKGAGYSVNVPWERAGMGDGDYIHGFHQIIMPIAFEFDPDLVIVSAGFDAAEGDVIGGCRVSPNCYAYMTHLLKSLASGHLVVVLEGGYNLSAIASSALAVTKVLLGDPPGPPRTKLPSASAIRVIDDVHKVHSRYWKCLRPAVPMNEPTDAFDEESLTGKFHGRQYQQKCVRKPTNFRHYSWISS